MGEWGRVEDWKDGRWECLNCDSCDERIAMIKRRGRKRLNLDSCDERIAMIKSGGENV